MNNYKREREKKTNRRREKPDPIPLADQEIDEQQAEHHCEMVIPPLSPSEREIFQSERSRV